MLIDTPWQGSHGMWFQGPEIETEVGKKFSDLVTLIAIEIIDDLL